MLHSDKQSKWSMAVILVSNGMMGQAFRHTLSGQMLGDGEVNHVDMSGKGSLHVMVNEQGD